VVGAVAPPARGLLAPCFPHSSRRSSAVLPLASTPGLFSITRTSIGYVGAASTPDSTGRSGWARTASGGMSYSSAGGLLAAAGRRVKNPEGPLTLERFPIAGAGKCLLLYYFNSCPGYACPGVKRSARNPYWLSAAWEEPGRLWGARRGGGGAPEPARGRAVRRQRCHDGLWDRRWVPRLH